MGSGLPDFPAGSSCLLVLRCPGTVHGGFGYGVVTLYDRPFQARSPTTWFGNCMRVLPPLHWVLQHPPHNAGRLSRVGGFGLFPVRSPLLRELFLFFGVLRCFSSPTCLSVHHTQSTSLSRGGCPIRRSPDRSESDSPELIAAYPRPSSALLA